MSRRTIEALMARGIDSSLAAALGKSYTLGKLKQLQRAELLQLGLSDKQVGELYQESRPPIPKETLHRVLYKNRRTCCICRESNKPVVVHHITEWAKSRNHDESNLAVLCLEHHDLAHTHKLLSQGLTEQEIRESKRKWEEDIVFLDTREVLKLRSDSDYSRWDWINIHRLFELILRRGVRLDLSQPIVEYLQGKQFIDKKGILRPENDWITEKEPRSWFLDFADGARVAYYLSLVVEEVLKTLPVIDITSYIQRKGQLKSLLREGDYIAAQLPFYFKAVDAAGNAKGEKKRAYYKGYGLRIEYVFDAWHCTSCSARLDAMTGRKVQTVFGLVRSMLDEDGEFVISISCLASGTAFACHASRN